MNAYARSFLYNINKTFFTSNIQWKISLHVALISNCHITSFVLTYRDSGNTIHFSIFTMQIFPTSQKITIP